MPDDTDVFNVSAAYDKPAYIGGDIITITVSGEDVHTSTVQEQIGPITIPLKAVGLDGSVRQTTYIVPAEFATKEVVEHDSVVIDTSVPIIDSSPTPRQWTPSADLLSITATA